MLTPSAQDNYPESAGQAPRCWILSDGKAGHQNQSIGLAEALGLSYQLKQVRLAKPWDKMPAWAIPQVLTRLAPESDRLTPPYPSLIIGNGRSTAAVGAALRQLAGATCKVIHLQTPPLPLDRFDLVIPPAHDGTRGSNVVTTAGALNRVNQTLLAAARTGPFFQARKPATRYVTVLIGGSNKHYRLDQAAMAAILAKLDLLLADRSVHLLITPSRRTDPTALALLRSSLDRVRAEIWDFSGDNPYFTWLAAADAVLVTVDSVSMISEACATGKPVYLLDLPGKPGKFGRFHDNLRQDGHVRDFVGSIDFSWHPKTLAEAVRVAELVRQRLALA